jgi:hypothetical protein
MGRYSPSLSLNRPDVDLSSMQGFYTVEFNGFPLGMVVEDRNGMCCVQELQNAGGECSVTGSPLPKNPMSIRLSIPYSHT